MLPLSIGPGQASGERAAQSRALKAEARKHFGLGEGDSVFVAEITCGEVDCPEVESVIAVFLEGQRREFKLHKPVSTITADDLSALASQPV